jgi:hypothetical protein
MLADIETYFRFYINRIAHGFDEIYAHCNPHGDLEIEFKVTGINLYRDITGTNKASLADEKDWDELAKYIKLACQYEDGELQSYGEYLIFEAQCTVEDFFESMDLGRGVDNDTLMKRIGEDHERNVRRHVREYTTDY